MAGVHVLALLDQAVVSGSSFLMTVIIGRNASGSELGVYALGMSLLILVCCVHEGLISSPYTIQRHRPLGTPAQHAGSSLALSGMLSTLTIFILGGVALGMSSMRVRPDFVAVSFVLAAAAPFALLREFARRFAFARLEVSKALVLDIAVVATQFTAICWLVWDGRLSATTALAAIGAACGLTGGIWLYLARGHFTIDWRHTLETMQRSWSLGKWLFANHLATQTQRQLIFWPLAWILGTTATGIFAACFTIASLAVPLVLGLSNIVYAKMALALKERGVAGLQREATRNALLFGAAVLMFCVPILFAGDEIIRLVFGDEFAGHGHIITGIALSELAFAVGIPAHNALSSMGCAHTSFWTSFVVTILMGVLVFPLVSIWGLVGAAYLILLACIVWSAAGWAVFLELARAMVRTTDSDRLNPDSGAPIGITPHIKMDS